MLGLVACSAREVPPAAHVPAVVVPDAASVPVAMPGVRLPDVATPVAYDVRLELDPDAEVFSGSVEIRVRLERATDRVWLHTDQLELATATYRAGTRSGSLATIAVDDGKRGLAFGESLTGEVTLAFAFTGRVAHAQEGVFRERAGGRWYLYAQSEAAFARRIVPCFDEPRFKPAWRVTLVVPERQVAIANGAQVSDTKLADGRHAIAFAEVAAMPSYLFAFAVGPFAVVPAGTVGRANVPVRVAVPPADARQVGVVAAKLPAIVDALERYLDRPLPLAKLDLVGVPSFFGAMENVGIITFESGILVGDPKTAAVARRFVRFTSHEIAHQWFGNAATPAWWDDLWLAEGFASWLGEKVSDQLGGWEDPSVRAQLSRLHALAADDEPDARPMRGAIAKAADADDHFDAISYEKGGSVLEMIEAFLGADAFRDVVRGYLRAAAGHAVTADDFTSALARTSPPAADALRWFLAQPGTPVVEIAAECSGTPRLTLRARTGTVPVCVRHDKGRACRVVERAPVHVELDACPKWLVGNAGGTGYYRVAVPPLGAAAPRTPAEYLAHADDVGAAVLRGDLALADALAELEALAGSRRITPVAPAPAGTRAPLAGDDDLRALAALVIATAIDPIVDDVTRPAWTRWLAARFARRLTKTAVFEPRGAIQREARDRLVALVADRVDAAAVTTARAVVDRALAGGYDPPDFALAIAARRAGKPLFDRVVALAAAATEDDREAVFELLGAFDPDFAPRVVELVLDRRFKPAQVAPALVAMLARPATRTAAWAALHDRADKLATALAPAELDSIVAAAGSLCDAYLVAELRALPDRPARARAIAKLERCAERRARLGDLAAALP